MAAFFRHFCRGILLPFMILRPENLIGRKSLQNIAGDVNRMNMTLRFMTYQLSCMREIGQLWHMEVLYISMNSRRREKHWRQPGRIWQISFRKMRGKDLFLFQPGYGFLKTALY